MSSQSLKLYFLVKGFNSNSLLSFEDFLVVIWGNYMLKSIAPKSSNRELWRSLFDRLLSFRDILEFFLSKTGFS